MPGVSQMAMPKAIAEASVERSSRQAAPQDGERLRERMPLRAVDAADPGEHQAAPPRAGGRSSPAGGQDHDVDARPRAATALAMRNGGSLRWWRRQRMAIGHSVPQWMGIATAGGAGHRLGGALRVEVARTEAWAPAPHRQEGEVEAASADVGHLRVQVGVAGEVDRASGAGHDVADGLGLRSRRRPVAGMDGAARP